MNRTEKKENSRIKNTRRPGTRSPGLEIPAEWLDRRAESLNALSHGVMALLVATLILLQRRLVHGSDLLFLFCLLFLFTVSAIYHGLPAASRWKNRLNRLDHMAIYWAIAGTYTPVALTVITGTTGRIILLLQWLLVAAGMLFKTVAFRRERVLVVLSVLLYVLMGWMALFFLPFLPVLDNLPFWASLLAGGLSYTAGLIFFSRSGRYSHFIWHLFVIGGAVWHLLALFVFR